MARSRAVAIVGAGIGGLAAAVDLAVAGCDVDVYERAAAPGGKVREVVAGGRPVDSGPTVFTLRDVFEELFADAGETLAEHLPTRPLDVLARHAWSGDERLDLYADVRRSADAIGAFAGPAEARRFLAFMAEARRVHATLDRTFMRAPRPNPLSLTKRVGFTRLHEMLAIRPFATLWHALGEHFRDARLRQLYGRYATYCGSSPFAAPATLMLIAHVEQAGVWSVDGGMHRIAVALARLAERHGARFHYGRHVREIRVAHGRAAGLVLDDGTHVAADAVVMNGDAAALASGALGAVPARSVPAQPSTRRSLSAITWSLHARTAGLPLARHTVFFSRDYEAEFDDLFRHARVPREPTVYVCAQDRLHDDAAPDGPERLLCLINAPADGDHAAYGAEEIESCADRTFEFLERCGLRVGRTPDATVTTTPAQFARLFPGTGGALYGQASHGWQASFRRPGSRTRLPGLYLAGGSAHPGAGVPMAAISGRLAATRLLRDLASTSPWRLAATSGGTSTR